MDSPSKAEKMTRWALVVKRDGLRRPYVNCPNCNAAVDLADAFTAYPTLRCWSCHRVKFIDTGSNHTVEAEAREETLPDYSMFAPEEPVSLGKLVIEWNKRFSEKQQDYADTHLFLGSKGQFSDMNRKFWKLYRAVWQGQPLVGEQAEEIAFDLVGHCFLLIDSLRKEAQK